MRLRNTGYVITILRDVTSHKTMVLTHKIFRRRHRKTRIAIQFLMNSHNDRMPLLEIRQLQAEANTIRLSFTLVCFTSF